jgi:TATA-box binding protein (TBP) (component of TFIID and TFIIIB)
MRIMIGGVYKEFHIKIFNTGKIEMPGIQNLKHIPIIIQLLLDILHPLYPTLVYHTYCEDIVLINSNFNCGYFIKRHELYHILKCKYNISAVYDPCSYPGIQCKIYHDTVSVVTTLQPIVVSFMVFRTGSVLIVGKCSEKIIREIYEYLSAILIKEYPNIINTNCVHHKKNAISRKNKKFILLS